MAQDQRDPGEAYLELGPAAFDVGVEWHDQTVVLSVSGTVDMLSAPQLSESILTALSNSPKAVIVDLAHVEFLASAGMTVLIAANEQIMASARFGVVADGPATGHPMELVGVDKLITIYPTLDAAIADMAEL
ncbi:STAS domain-containing protein [Antrihabitans sp. YC2-6]|uniref:STAS domain-containing protein n=1 Tax=Antrihabitans sp. YC2-6 TaxID=2799498 RepID=UPI001F192A13|nr:STAS domain-containing protein [Antrihabitans sp. YC2-6]